MWRVDLERNRQTREDGAGLRWIRCGGFSRCWLPYINWEQVSYKSQNAARCLPSQNQTNVMQGLVCLKPGGYAEALGILFDCNMLSGHIFRKGIWQADTYPSYNEEVEHFRLQIFGTDLFQLRRGNASRRLKSSGSWTNLGYSIRGYNKYSLKDRSQQINIS